MYKILNHLSFLSSGNRLYLVILFLFTAFLLASGFQYDLNEWDESRLGSNSFEMYYNHDYINLHYDGKPDTWIAKPPLLNWLIVLSYTIFGFNEIALRLPNYIAGLILFTVLIRLIVKCGYRHTALLTCLILLSTKTILGWHSALTGDYDILLTLFLLTSVYYFIDYCDSKSAYSLYLSSIFTGLAFYTKGTAAFIFLPGFALYLLITKELTQTIKSRAFLFSTCIIMAIVGSWLLALTMYGNRFDTSFYGSKNALSTLFLDDTLRRIADSRFQDKSSTSPFFVFIAMDVRLNLWSYFIYIAVAVLISKVLKIKAIEIKKAVAERTNRLVVLSICIVCPLFLILTFSKTQHDWYLIPAFVIIAYLIASFILAIGRKWKGIYYLSFLLLVFTMGRQMYYMHEQPTILHNTFNRQNPLLKSAREIVTIGMPRHHIYLYMQWMHLSAVKLTNSLELPTQKGKLLLLCTDQLKEIPDNSITTLQIFDEFVIARIN